MIFVRVLGQPVRNLYRDARALPHLPIGEARHELLDALGTLHSSGEGESPNLTITLRNDSGQCARLFATPPLGVRVEVRDAVGVVFAGSLRRIDLADGACRLGVES